MRPLAMLASLAAVVVAALCAAVVALAVVILRALDTRGVDLAGALLDAMGARRARGPQRVRVVVRPAAVAPQRPATSSHGPPANRRRVRALDGPASVSTATQGWPCAA